MKAGDTFFLTGGAADRHLRVIISDPAIDSERVLFVSMTSYDVTKEDVCLIHPGGAPVRQAQDLHRLRERQGGSSRRAHSASGRWATPIERPCLPRTP